jgi:hypothetical protein
LPVRIKFDELPAEAMPRSSSARFSERWQNSVGDEGFLDGIVDRWRNCSAMADAGQSAAMFAESVQLPPGAGEPMLPAVAAASEERRAAVREPRGERHAFGPVRREIGSAAGEHAGTGLRARREKLHQR